MARWTESVRVNLFCSEQGRTLTQSLALRQEETSARLETASKHEHNEAVGSRVHRTLCPVLWLFYLGASDNTFLLQWTKLLPQTSWRSFLLLVRRPSLHSSLLRCVFLFVFSFISVLLKKSPDFFQVSSSALSLPLQSLLKFLHLIQTRPLCRSRPRRAECGEVESTGSLFFFFFFCRASITWCVWHAVWSHHGTNCLLSKERSKNLFTPVFNLSK